MTRLGRRAALVLAFSAVVLTSAPASAAPSDQLQVVSVGLDGKRNVALVLRLGPDAPTEIPATAFSVTPRSDSDPLRVSRLGARDLDLMLVYPGSGDAAVLRGVRAAAAEVLLTLPSGARVGVAGTPAAMSSDTSAAVLTLDRVRTDRNVHALFADALAEFERSLAPAGRHRAVLLFDAGPYPATAQEVLDLSAKAETSGVVVYVLRLLGGTVPDDALDVMAARTGGLVSIAARPDELGASYQRILVDLESRYDLRFRLPDRVASSIRVSVKQGAETKTATVPIAMAAGEPKPELSSSKLSAVIFASALGAVLVFVLFARLWVSFQRPDPIDRTDPFDRL